MLRLYFIAKRVSGCCREMSTTVRPLSAHLQEVACRELNEDPKRREQDLAHIKEWLKKQPHLNARTDDQWLLTFLRGCKFSLERTKEKLDTYYTMRTMCPEFFTNRDPMLPEIQEVLKLGNYLPLSTVDDKGCRLVIARAKGDPSKMKMETGMKVNFMLLDIMLNEDDDNTICGNVGLMDLTGMTLGHMTQFTPSMAKKMALIFQEAYPTRPKGMHYIHVPGFFMTMMNFFNTLLKDKLKKRLHIYGSNIEPLYEAVPQKSLPIEYGGESGNVDDLTAAWKKKVESYREWFLEDEKYKSNEKKRPGKPKTHDSLFGLEGSFRSLNVD